MMSKQRLYFVAPLTGNHVSPERLEEFRRIYKEVYGDEITAEEAVAMTTRLLTLYDLLSRPVPGAPAQHPPSSSHQDQRSSEAT
jgi:hypothetical protein